MTKIFLSYVREDSDVAARIADGLKAAGHDVWWDRHIRGGAEFAEEIDKALGEAEAVVVLWSRRSIGSAWVRDEAGVGRDAGRLIPVRIDDCTPPLGFRQYQALELRSLTRRHDPAALALLDETVRGVAHGAGPPPAARSTRRNVVIGAGTTLALAAAGGAALVYRRDKGHSVPESVAPMVTQAMQMLHQNTREGQYQAIGLFQRAVELAPNYAEGWGWLGYAYAVISHFRERSEGLSLQARGTAAAKRAIELDRRSGMGELALSAAPPLIGHWDERERHMLRAFDFDRRNDEILVHIGVSHTFAGRARDALPFFAKINHKPLSPAEYTSLCMGLWSAGRLPELDQALKEAAALYPTQGSIWFTRLNVAMFSGDTGAVKAMLDDVQGRPTSLTDEAVASIETRAYAIQSRDTAAVAEVLRKDLQSARSSAGSAQFAIRNASALGKIDRAFELCNAYFFGRPFVIPDFASKGSGFWPDQRQTAFLFEPSTSALRLDRRFEDLMRRLGFDAYWRNSGHVPDYRRSVA